MGAFEEIKVSLPAALVDAMRLSVERGDYATEDALVQAVLNDWALANARARRTEWLRQALADADASGPGIPADAVFEELEALIASYDNGA